MTIGDGLVAIAAALAVMTGIFSTAGQGYVAAKAVEAVGKNPEAENEIRTMLILGAGIAETAAIYGLLIAFLILFAY
ncbi:MAG TPA: ATP synthase F0 subunit C [Chitinophagaceae bacterium]|uniref:ATP synthase subunit c n=1 Tax=Atopostipes suicloacalis DSM 15692 TaxID=1121025 RepID=A0A1M4YAW9_9LACT|nr:ATP synthase F0 subunit C [Atopostipes suicloacalis]SHF02773.1 F-type H+-transporting ATPase subunit c [Atopostipes suicloacalis DSM 15692]HLS70242.1 ATP synthase F0 subunit C [Chitinophagaceae bacterium]